MRPALLVILTVAVASCGGPTVADLTVSVTPVGDPSQPSELVVVNTSDRSWHDVRVVLEQAEVDGSTTPCGARTVGSWEPGQEVRLPACGERTRIGLETEGSSAAFVFAGGTLYRRIGRKEVPIAG